ncbi:maltose phosphorylase [Kineothrix alysoides]|uniref:Maltose phosphorylase n=1 Tax=Kineothrix alysoides TaxID=1469948 RepID=A0A4R1QTQ2_9FIRM|nr:glycosyl hydrolase family 65 protein [Kineothrix alysoides]TCL56887.1 maltose phosphorylase [Kineothrix alysoides]
MAKFADKYFLADAWKIIEDGFDPEYGEVAESVFSQANEYMGVRGYFEEGYTGAHMQGSYFNGIYEEKKQGSQGYKGVVDTTEFMVNAVDFLYTRINLDGETLDIGTCNISSFKRTLDMKSGLLTRSFLWETKSGRKLELVFERLLSMKKNKIAVQRITAKALNFDGDVTVVSGLDFDTVHQSAKESLWKCRGQKAEDSRLAILGETVRTGQHVYSSCYIDTESGEKPAVSSIIGEKRVAIELVIRLDRKKAVTVTKKIYNAVHKNGSIESFLSLCDNGRKELEDVSFEGVLQDNICWWKNVWRKADITIEGDEWNQQGIRFCIFQMFQTYHGAAAGTNIGAKGLTGEAYNGNAFWDTETYCLPFFLFNDVQAAKNLLMFRYLTLKEAKERAADLDCRGAFYPVATISGKECCNLWQHASLQLQASTAVAYGIWFYEKLTQDIEFLMEYGMEMLIEICRMLADRGGFTEDRKKFGYYGVMGPDEFQMMVNNNCYTNYMAKFTFSYTLSVCRRLKEEKPKEMEALCLKRNLTEEECREWKEMEENMFLPFDEKTGIYEQHEGYFKLPHVDVDHIPVEDFPLYNHWSYDRIYRNDMIKQPDVLMFMLLLNSAFGEDILRANYEFYEPRCIHESSLSPSVHSILASQLKKHEEAYRFFQFATRMDLDNYNRNSSEGLHTTSIAAAWMNIVYGFGGLRSDGENISLCPSMPKQWRSYSFRIGYREDVLLVEVDGEKVCLSTLEGKAIDIDLYGELVAVGKEPKEITVPAAWRG